MMQSAVRAPVPIGSGAPLHAMGSAGGHSSGPLPRAAVELDDAEAVHGRKRKAGTQENERLSKRLSLLNLEKNGSKLYVPVEAAVPHLDQARSSRQQAPPGSDSMQLDESKHKVYIYNIDEELASENEDEGGKLLFLPNIEKHLRENRIPPCILAKLDAGLEEKQVVLYSDPKSLTVDEDRDGVRRVIIDARQRVREKQRLEREGNWPSEHPTNHADMMPAPVMNMPAQDMDEDAMDLD